MKLSVDEINVLATRHGNTRESRAVRAKLDESGLRYCAYCATIHAASTFNDKAKRLCKQCIKLTRKQRGTLSRIIVTTPERIAESVRRYRDRRPERVQARKRAAYAGTGSTDAHREQSVRRRKADPELVKAEQRRNYRDRRSLGMTSKEASYSIDSSHWEDRWQEFLRNNRA